MSYIVNPEAVGNPNETPIVEVGPGLARFLRPCTESLPSGPCGGVNGFHRADCPRLPTGSTDIIGTVNCTCGHPKDQHADAAGGCVDCLCGAIYV